MSNAKYRIFVLKNHVIRSVDLLDTIEFTQWEAHDMRARGRAAAEKLARELGAGGTCAYIARLGSNKPDSSVYGVAA